MNAAYNPYLKITSTHELNASSEDKFSPIFVGYRNGTCNRGYSNKANNALYLQQLEINDDMCTDYHHHQRIHSTNSSYKICGGCGDQIGDRFLLHALDRFWHNSCLKCHCCGTLLADVGSSCFTRRGLILCKKDYSSMFGCSGICSGCGETIPPSELVAKAVAKINHGSKSFENQKSEDQPLIFVFHLKCFACTKCGANLRPGDRYTMLGTNIVCEQDWQKILKNTSTANVSVSTVRKGKVGRPRRNKE